MLTDHEHPAFAPAPATLADIYARALDLADRVPLGSAPHRAAMTICRDISDAVGGSLLGSARDIGDLRAMAEDLRQILPQVDAITAVACIIGTIEHRAQLIERANRLAIRDLTGHPAADEVTP